MCEEMEATQTEADVEGRTELWMKGPGEDSSE